MNAENTPVAEPENVDAAPSDARVTEMVAFNLFKMAEIVTQPHDALWRSQPETRKDYRDKAKTLIAQLDSSGVRLTPVQRPLKVAFESLQITPAAPAYSVDEI